MRGIVAIARPPAVVCGAGRAWLLGLCGHGGQSAPAARVILLCARAAEAVLGISAPVLQVVAALRHQLTASLFGVAVAIGSGWLIVGHQIGRASCRESVCQYV